MPDDRMTLFGTLEAGPDERPLSAGPLSAVYSDGALRAITLQGVEVIRGIYFLIRDRNWATATPEIRDLEIVDRPDRFDVRFAAHCLTPSDGQRLVWTGRITGSAEDGLAFEAEATPDDDLVTRRTGFIVLHPLERVVGAAATIEHTDGRLVETTFPDLVDPLQSFFEVRAMTHEPIPGIRATCRMEGGGWETEDHRNWMDASFKTYFRALALPHPYTITKGETVRQRVSVRFEPSIAALRPPPAPAETVVTVGDRTGGRMPAVGLGVAPDALDAALAVAPAAAALGARDLALRLRTDTPDLPGFFRRFAALAAALGARPALELAVADRGGWAAEIELAAIAAGQAGLTPASLFVTPEVDLGAYPPSVERPPSAPLGPLYALAREAFPGAAIGGGAFHFFTELNRRRPPVDGLDFVQHGTAASVHAADDRSVMETLETLPHIFRSVRAMAPGLAYRIGPAQIAMAMNPYGAATTPNPDRRRLTMATDDPRHAAQFGAAYAAGYLARAALGGVDLVTMGALTGPFAALAGDAPTPLFRVLSAFAAIAGFATLQTASSDPRDVLAAAAEGPRGRTLIVVNIGPEPRRVRLAGLAPARLSVLEAGGGGDFVDGRPQAEAVVALPPYAVTRATW